MANELEQLIKGLSAAKAAGKLSEVAERAKVSKKTAERIMAGKTDPVYSNVFRLRAALMPQRKKVSP